jgi:hypothetical protein
MPSTSPSLWVIARKEAFFPGSTGTVGLAWSTRPVVGTKVTDISDEFQRWGNPEINAAAFWVKGERIHF